MGRTIVSPRQQNVRAFLSRADGNLSDLFSLTGQHTMRGVTKEKTRKLDELKAKRKAKDEKQRVCVTLAIGAQC